MNSTALEIIYGRPKNYRAKVAVKSGELVQLGTRGAVACCDIAQGETDPVYVRGDFFFDCASDAKDSIGSGPRLRFGSNDDTLNFYKLQKLPHVLRSREKCRAQLDFRPRTML